MRKLTESLCDQFNIVIMETNLDLNVEVDMY